MPRGRQIARFEPFGLVSDPAPESLPPEVWSGVRNMMFREHPQRVKGLAEVYGTPLFPPKWVQFGFDATLTPVWLYAGDAGIAYTDGASHTDITPADFLAPVSQNNPWTGGVLNNVIFCGNQRRFWYWPGTGDMVVLPGWGASDNAGAMRAYQYHLIAMSTDDGTGLLLDQISWSNAAQPGTVPNTWLPAPDNEAGFTQLSTTPGAIIDGRALRGVFVAYKSTSAYTLTYVGGSNVMLARLLFSEGGILTRNCVASLAQFHLVLTDGDVILHDGQVAKSLVEGRIRRGLFNRANGDAIRRSFVVADENNGEVWICVPEAGADVPNIAYVWNQRRDTWAIRTLPEGVNHIGAGQVRLQATDQAWNADPDAWDTDPSPWDTGAPRIDFYALLEASASSAAGVGRFFAVDGDFLRAGLPVDAVIEREGITLGNAEQIKTIKAVWIEARGTPGTELSVRIAGNDTPGESPAYGAAATYVIGTSRKVDLYATGRYLAIQVAALTLTEVEPFELVSVSFEHESRGLY